MIRIRQLKLKYLDESIIDAVKKRLKINKSEIKNIKIVKKSLDCRKDNIYNVYTVDVLVKDEDKVLKKNKDRDIFSSPNEEYVFGKTKKLNTRPIIIGSGPAGLFCAYLLAINNYRPIIYERGKDIDNRIIDVNKFWDNNILNYESNVCFGEGGAGTFSDGKLNTLIQDKNFRIKKVLEIFVENGAPEDILYMNKPHIGTDILRKVVINMRKKIIALGGEYHFSSCLTDILIKDNHVFKIVINNKEIVDCSILVLAIGHSATDTLKMLNKRDIKLENKDFAVGLRIMHPQKLIDNSQYNNSRLLLPPASYKLVSHTKNNRGCYTFCMCPGGYVVNASSSEKKLVVNGMSYRKRDSGVANSAILVTISKKDYGNKLFAGLDFQEHLEKKAYEIANGLIPIQYFKDYLSNKVSKVDEDLIKIKGQYQEANLNLIFPKDINDSLKEGIKNFGKKIKGFDTGESVLAGVESRTSSAIRILRDENFETNIKGIYPIGEGAGYAGGITSSAVDGIKVAEQIGAERNTNNA